MSLVTTQTQWAVGQGFFHSGTVGYDAGPWPLDTQVVSSYVYDCGTLGRRWLLRREIAQLAIHQPNVDTVYLSHFDADHVNGIRRLAGAVNVGRFVIPYVSGDERLLLAAHFLVENASTSMPQDYIGLLSSPPDWFAGLPGEPVVIEVDPEFTVDPDAEGAPNFPDPLRDTTSELTAEQPAAAVFPDRPQGARRLRVPNGSVVARIDALASPESGRAEELITRCVWIWQPYILKAGLEHRRAFVAALSASVPGFTPQSLEDPVWIRRLIERHWDALRAAYPAASGARNLTSMCLYSGPPPEVEDVEVCWCHSVRPRLTAIGGGPAVMGWLGAGDADLGDPRRAREFLAAFRGVSGHVGIFAIPHHGAERSWNGLLLDGFAAHRQPTCVVGSVPGYRGWQHPAPAVLASVADHGGHLVVVTGSEAARWSVTMAARFGA